MKLKTSAKWEALAGVIDEETDNHGRPTSDGNMPAVSPSPIVDPLLATEKSQTSSTSEGEQQLPYERYITGNRSSEFGNWDCTSQHL